MEQVYNPLVSGMNEMSQVRKHLLSNGMTRQFTDILAAKYIRNLENKEDHKIFRVLDLFDTNKDRKGVIRTMNNCQMDDISMNYQTLASYQRDLYDTQRT